MHRAISINTLCLAPAPLAGQIETVARLGARGISPDLEQVKEAGLAKTAAALRDTGLAVATLTHRAFAFAAPEQTGAARDRLLQTIAIAAEIGAENIIMTTGGRGSLTWPEAAKSFAEAIAPCAEAARNAAIGLGIEPTSHLYSDVSIVHRLSDTVTLAKSADISVMIDLFACWTDSDIDRALAEAAPISPLAQICDYVYGDRGLPCRAVPGDGAVPYERLVPIMVQAGFAGWWDLEIIGPRLQAEGQEVGLKRAAAHIGHLLELAGAAG
jgi:sugar phosphate isomerase/epimerase